MPAIMAAFAGTHAKKVLLYVGTYACQTWATAGAHASRCASNKQLYPRLPYLGPLQQIRVGTTGEGMSATWHLRNCTWLHMNLMAVQLHTVLHASDGHTAAHSFICTSWLYSCIRFYMHLMAMQLRMASYALHGCTAAYGFTCISWLYGCAWLHSCDWLYICTSRLESSTWLHTHFTAVQLNAAERAFDGVCCTWLDHCPYIWPAFIDAILI
eukprot:1158219-Pelagomonas_calceolata.AAC.7